MDYKVGSIIKYTTFGGTVREVEVTNKEDDIKNGCAGFDGKLLNSNGRYGDEVWGYDDQIIEVVKY